MPLPPPPDHHAGPASPDAVRAALEASDYLADDLLATVVFLALRLGRPLFLEGEPGVGKTELAKALARISGAELIRLQCYEGIDAAQAVYDWDYPRQLLHLRAAEASGRAASTASDALEGELYDERFLLRRPLLRAIAHRGDRPPVLLIDEVDRADDEFEAFLLEVLSDFQISIPELGVVRAERPPVVVLTSNRTRDVHDALKRRCLYHWIEHPTAPREWEILRRRVPAASATLAEQTAGAAAALRALALAKPPGIAETIDWLHALTDLGVTDLGEHAATMTAGTVVKDRDDAATVERVGWASLLGRR